MADRQYIYSGPLTSITLPGGKDVALCPGATVTLPDDSPYTRRLVALKRLTEEPSLPALSQRERGPKQKEDVTNAS